VSPTDARKRPLSRRLLCVGASRTSIISAAVVTAPSSSQSGTPILWRSSSAKGAPAFPTATARESQASGLPPLEASTPTTRYEVSRGAAPTRWSREGLFARPLTWGLHGKSLRRWLRRRRSGAYQRRPTWPAPPQHHGRRARTCRTSRTPNRIGHAVDARLSRAAMRVSATSCQPAPSPANSPSDAPHVRPHGL
jgi:hypothetical protein